MSLVDLWSTLYFVLWTCGLPILVFWTMDLCSSQHPAVDLTEEKQMLPVCQTRTYSVMSCVRTSSCVEVIPLAPIYRHNLLQASTIN